MNNCEISFKGIFDLDEYSHLLPLVDAELVTEDGCHFNVNRDVLAKGNPYFQALLHRFGEDKCIFRIPHICGESLSEILIFLYTKQIIISDKNVTEILIDSDYLLLETLHNEAHKRIAKTITVGNCLELLLYSTPERWADAIVYAETFRFIETHFDQVIKTNNELLPELPVSVLKDFLKSRSLYNITEMDLWEVIVLWISKDSERMSEVPVLLSHLAGKEIDKHLARIILSDHIVKHNPHCNFLNQSGNETDLETILNFLRHSSNHLNDQGFHLRVPSRLCLTAKLYRRAEAKFSEIFISYDEKVDLWRKVTEVNFHPYQLISKQHILYILDHENHRCLMLDLLTQEKKYLMKMFDGTSYFRSSRNNFYVAWLCRELLSFTLRCLGLFGLNRILDITNLMKTEYSFRHPYFCSSVLEMNGLLYFVKPIEIMQVVLEIFDPESDTWKCSFPSFKIDAKAAVTILDKIYFVGLAPYDIHRMAAQVYNTTNGEWSILPPPSVLRYQFGAVNYLQQLFVIGGRNSIPFTGVDFLQDVEIFNPITNEWRNVRSIPVQAKLHIPKILRGKLYVCSYDDFVFIGNIYPYYGVFDMKSAHIWNNSDECWEVTTIPPDIPNWKQYRLWEVNDEEDVKSLWKTSTCKDSALQRLDIYKDQSSF